MCSNLRFERLRSYHSPKGNLAWHVERGQLPVWKVRPGKNEKEKYYMNECFYEAAVRHWIDGKILNDQEEYDGAVCMFGFAAECVLKKMLEKNLPVDEIRKRYSHRIENMFRDIRMLLLEENQIMSWIDPAVCLKLSQISFPDVLFHDHPDRRYFCDGIYGREEAQSCQNAVDELMKEIFKMRLDGAV